jgi:uncharacterized protein
MDISQAIGGFLAQGTKQSKQSSTLSDAIEEVLDRVFGKAESSADDETDVFGQLAEAARSGNQSLFEELVAAEKQQTEDNEPSLLIASVMANQFEVVQALIAAGADVEARYKQFFEFNALSLAVSDERIEIAQALLEAGADPNWNNASPGLTPIVEAINKGNIELVRLLLAHHASTKFDTGFKLLVKAAEKGNPEIVRLLLEAGCNPNDSDHSGSALRQACIRCDVDTMRVLLEAGAEVPLQGDDVSAIFYAPFMAKQLAGLLGEQPDPTPYIPQALQVVIDAGTNLNLQDQHKSTLLSSAVGFGHLEAMQILLKAGADPNLSGKVPNLLAIDQQELRPLIAKYSEPTHPLNLAAALGHLAMIQPLVDAGADINFRDEQGRSAIDIAIKEGHQAIVKLLRQAGAELSQGSEAVSADALLGAAKKGNVEILRSALEAGISPNASEAGVRQRQDRSKTALIFACEGGHLEAASLLIEFGADVNLSDRAGKKLGRTPLMYAAESDNADLVQLLLEAGAIVDAQDKRGQTALFYAVEEEAIEAIEVLLEFGADPYKQSWEGTPFEHATYGDPEIVKLLMAVTKEENNVASNAAREEMLRSAAFDDNAELVHNLIQQGVNVSAADDHGTGWTALMFAAAKGNTTIVQLLIAAGADVGYKSASGQSALGEAKSWKNKEIIDLLKSASPSSN